MDDYILRLRAELAKSERAYTESKIRTTRLFHELQTTANPYFADDLDEIKADELLQISNDIAGEKSKMIEAKAKIKELKKRLGEV